MTRCAPVGSWLSTALHAAMPEENDTAWPPSSPPRTASKASHVSVASVRLYRRSVPSTKFDAGTSGVFRGAPGTRSGRPPTMAQVSGFIGAWKSPRSRLEARVPDRRADVGSHIAGHGRLEDVGQERPDGRLRLVADARRERLDHARLERRPRMGGQNPVPLLGRERVEVRAKDVVLDAESHEPHL